MAEEAWGNDIDIMIGGTSLEGLFFFRYFSNMEKDMLSNLSLEKHFYTEIGLGRSEVRREEYAKQLKRLYCGDESPSLEKPLGYIEVSYKIN